jgi:hypothetical protein
MCSTPVQRISEIGEAIDDLAVAALAAYPPERQDARAGDTADVSDADQVVIRLAQLWEKLAELDPEVARKLPRYQA